MKYIALIRGVNVSGKNKLPMAKLKEAFLQNNFTEVKTYINSGNIIFSSEVKSEKLLQNSIAKLIKDHFQITTPVLVLSAQNYIAAVEEAPDWWNKEKDTLHQAIFIIPPHTTKEITSYIEKTQADIERVHLTEKVVFFSAPMKTYTKAKWYNISRTPAFHFVTIRNANTTLKLLSLLQE